MRRAAQWIERYRRFWTDQLDALAAYLEDGEPKASRPQPRKKGDDS
jgi:hypothetical protein